jgi:hypothetical protein
MRGKWVGRIGTVRTSVQRGGLVNPYKYVTLDGSYRLMVSQPNGSRTPSYRIHTQVDSSANARLVTALSTGP